jgi:hypothetical protein
MKVLLIVGWLLLLLTPQKIQNASIETILIKLKVLKERQW